MRVHFLNVGQGDCSIIEFLGNERTMMVDINSAGTMDGITFEENHKATLFEAAGYNIPLTDPLKYMESHGIKQIFRFVVTHPHMDHISGISKIKDMCVNAWIYQNEFSEPEGLSGDAKDDWELYEKWRDSKASSNPKILSLSAGASNSYYKEDGISILSPTDELVEIAHKKNNRNIMSTVLLIKHGKTKIVLAGDAEKETWKYIMENHADKIENISILKAAHHGRDSGYYQEAVELMSPEYVVVSVGKKPEQDASNKYRNYSDYVLSTRWCGNMIFKCFKDGSINLDKEYNR